MSCVRRVRLSPPLGRLLIAAGLAAAFLLVLVPGRPASAAEPAGGSGDPERKNCPSGFVWIRMSGTACVQDAVPEYGRIGYDGHAICDDAHVGVYEFRKTTDGRGVDGNPAVWYSYLLRCVTPEEAARAEARAPATDLTRLLLAGDVDLPQGMDLVYIAATGAAGATILALARRRPLRTKRAATLSPPAGTPGPASDAPPTPPEPPSAAPALAPVPPEPAPLPTDPAEIDERITQLLEIDERLGRAAEAIRAEADAAAWTWEDYVTLVGSISDLLGPLTGPASPYVGAVSVAASISQITADAAGWSDVRSMYREMRGHLEEIAAMRGRIAGDVAALEQARADATGSDGAHDTGPDGPPPGETDDDPETLTDQQLRTEVRRAQQRVNDAFDADARAADEAARVRREQRDLRDTMDRCHRAVDDFDRRRQAGELPWAVEEANADANLGASFAGYVAQYGEDAAREVLAGATDEVRLGRLVGGNADAVFRASAGEQAARDLLGRAERAGTAANVVGAGTGAVSLVELYLDRSAEQQRVILEQMAENAAYRLGESDRVRVRADQRTAATTRAFREAVARRDGLRAEINRRHVEAEGQVMRWE